LLQAGFAVEILAVFFVKLFKPLNGFLRYGKTLSGYSTTKSTKNKNSRFNLFYLLNITVPKYYFCHFYILASILSLSAYILVNCTDNSTKLSILGSIYNRLKAYLNLFIIHSIRRLVECFFVSKFNKHSKMNISHYLVGVYLYLSINLNMILSFSITSCFTHSAYDNNDDDNNNIIIINTNNINPPQLILILFNLFCQANQLLNHLHLSKTVKYNQPDTGLFKYILNAHYFNEILIYCSFYLLVPNLTNLLILVWTFTNLSISSCENYKFYLNQR
ncbi:putative polyprenol reductase ASCRUDRAFT_18557, partial [Ascoidea rubescens DSM 1968]